MQKSVRLEAYQLDWYVARCRAGECTYASLPQHARNLRQEILRRCVLDVHDLEGTASEDKVVAIELSKCGLADTCARRLNAALQAAKALGVVMGSER